MKESADLTSLGIHKFNQLCDQKADKIIYNVYNFFVSRTTETKDATTPTHLATKVTIIVIDQIKQKFTPV